MEVFKIDYSIVKLGQHWHIIDNGTNLIWEVGYGSRREAMKKLFEIMLKWEKTSQ
jgi:hypothetical protein